MQIQQTNCTK